MIWRRRIAEPGAPRQRGPDPLLETSLMLGRREPADGACVQDDDGRVRAQLWLLEHSQLAAVGEMGAEQAAAAQHRRPRLRSLEGLAVESAREALACSPRPIPVLASQTRGERAGDDWQPLVGGPAADWQVKTMACAGPGAMMGIPPNVATGDCSIVARGSLVLGF